MAREPEFVFEYLKQVESLAHDILSDRRDIIELNKKRDKNREATRENNYNRSKFTGKKGFSKNTVQIKTNLYAFCSSTLPQLLGRLYKFTALYVHHAKDSIFLLHPMTFKVFKSPKLKSEQHKFFTVPVTSLALVENSKI
ncbi:p53 and DNA damage-regulated 1 [Brachionus plicatilis]|uniref:p53 and DNA damage-regulated 1 n=1 Tax=Brachionus plicatilis TaxID=10195 RepID=A0A3M7P3I5_BRAPC|nr:p53 and DNA damage-regulated 1 [Brachionus plicatilis]